MRKLNFGIIGCGSRGWCFVGDMSTRKGDAQLLAVAENNSLRLKTFVEHLNLDCLTFTDYREMLKLKELDVVIVVTPDFTHREICVDCFNAGKDVLCDKPLATSVADCDAIIEAQKKNGRRLFMGFNERYRNTHQKMRELVKSGVIGKPLLVSCLDYYEGGRTYFRRWNRLTEKSGGLLVHKGCHVFDLFNWIVESEPVRVSTFGGLNVFVPREGAAERCRDCKLKDSCLDYVDIKTRKDRRTVLYRGGEAEDSYWPDTCLYNSEKDTFDNSVAIIEYENGSRASNIECFFSANRDRRFSIVGPKGEIEVDDLNRTVEVWSPFRTEIAKFQLHYEAGMHGGADKRQIDHIVDCLMNKKQVIVEGEDARRSVLIGEAAEKSAREKKVIDIKEFLAGTKK